MPSHPMKASVWFEVTLAIIYHKDHVKGLLGGVKLGNTNGNLNRVLAGYSDNSYALLHYTDVHVQIMDYGVAREDASDLLALHFPGVFQNIIAKSEMRDAVFTFSSTNCQKVRAAVKVLMTDILQVVSI